MSLENYRLKLNKIKESSSSVPQYSLTYKIRAKDKSHASYAIISAFAEDRDMIVELNTDLLDSTLDHKLNYIQQFLNTIDELSLIYRHRKIPSVQNRTVLGFQIDVKKKVEAQEIIVYVPHAIWEKEAFRDILSDYGAKYYITKEPMDSGKIINEFWTLSEEEKADTFYIFLFDWAIYGQMGIFSNSVDTGELKRLLGL